MSLTIHDLIIAASANGWKESLVKDVTVFKKGTKTLAFRQQDVFNYSQGRANILLREDALYVIENS